MRFKYFYSILIFLMCLSCQEKEVYEPWKIKQINQRSERISMLMETIPTSVKLSLRGNVDGPYQIYLVGSQKQSNEILNFQAGLIDTIFNRSWADPVCKVIYIPNINKVKSGELEIDLKLISN